MRLTLPPIDREDALAPARALLVIALLAHSEDLRPAWQWLLAPPAAARAAAAARAPELARLALDRASAALSGAPAGRRGP